MFHAHGAAGRDVAIQQSRRPVGGPLAASPLAFSSLFFFCPPFFSLSATIWRRKWRPWWPSQRIHGPPMATISVFSSHPLPLSLSPLSLFSSSLVPFFTSVLVYAGPIQTRTDSYRWPAGMNPGTDFVDLAYTYTYIYIYIYIYTYIYIHTHTHTHICICIYVCMYLYIYMYVCACVQVHICMYIYTYRYIYVCTQIYICTCMYVCTSIHICTYIYVYMYTHIDTYIHIELAQF